MAVRYAASENRWTFDTPAEAAQFFQLVKEKLPALKLGPVRATWALPEAGKRLLVRLLGHPDGLPGKDLAADLGIKPSELGNVVVSIARWGEGYGLTRRDIILKRRARIGGGKSVRTLRLTSSFLKKVKTGTVKELKEKI